MMQTEQTTQAVHEIADNAADLVPETPLETQHDVLKKVAALVAQAWQNAFTPKN